MKTRNLISATLILILLFTTVAALGSAYIPSIPDVDAQTYPILVERGANYVIHQIDVNTYSWESQPQWVYDGSKWVPYIFNPDASAKNSGDPCYLVRTGLITVEVMKGYPAAKFWNPEYTEVRLYEERWTVEYYKANQWKDTGVGAQTPSFSVVENSTGVFITRTQSLVGVGRLTAIYAFHVGSPLKHTVIYEGLSSTTYEYRIKQVWNGIVGSRVKHSAGADTITAAKTINSVWFEFQKTDGSLSILEDQWRTGYLDDKLLYHNDVLQPPVIDVHAQGMKCEFIFQNSTLYTIGLGKSIRLDPDTATLTPPNKDSYVDSVNPNQNWGTATSLYVYNYYRIYVVFDASSIPSGATVSLAQLKLGSAAAYGNGNGRVDAHGCSDTSWGETTITWNNKPAYDGTIQDYQTPASGGTTTWTVTGWVNGKTGGLVGFLLKMNNEAAGYGTQFASKERDGNDPQLYVEYTATVSITITSSPATGSGYVTVDSTAYNTPQTFSWTPGSTHTLSASSTRDIVAGQSRYAYSSWSDGGAQTHTYTTPSSAATVTANFHTEYYFSVSSSYDSPTGAGWYDGGSSVSSTVTRPVSGGTGIQYETTGWTGTGSLSSGGTAGSSSTGAFTINAYTTCTWNWKTQYQVAITSSGIGSDSSGTVATLNGQAKTQAQLPYSNWFDSGYSLPYAFSSPVSAGTGKQYAWASTSGLGQTLQSSTFTVSGTGTITGTYIAQYAKTLQESTSATPTLTRLLGVGRTLSEVSSSLSDTVSRLAVVLRLSSESFSSSGSLTRALTFPRGISESLRIMRTTVIWDNGCTWWGAWSQGTGSYGVQKSDETTIKQLGSSSMKIAVVSGSGNEICVNQVFSPHLDWSDEKYLSFYLYGCNSGASITLYLLGPNWDNFWWKTFSDDWTGWKHFSLEIGTDLYPSGSPNKGDVSEICFSILPAAQCNLYFDYFATESSNEAVSRLSAWGRSLSESGFLSDSAGRLAVVFRGLSESNTVSDALARALAAGKNLSESFSSSMSVSALAHFPRAVFVSLTASDSLSRLANILRGLSESANLSDSASKLSTLFRSLSESPSLSDSLSHLIAVTRSLSQSLTLTDSASRLAVVLRSVAETATLTDTGSRLLAALRGATEPFTTSDASSRLLGVTKGITESFSSSETLGRLAAVARNLTEPGSFSDLVGRLVAVVRVPAESISLSDNAARLLVWARSLNEPFSSSDSVARAAYVLRSMSESLSSSDSLSRLSLILRTTSESLTATEGVVRAAAVSRSISESFSSSESLGRLLSVGRSLSESVTSADSASRLGAVLRSLSETLSLSDTSSRLAIAARSVTELLSADESLGRLGDLTRSMSESLAASGVSSRLAVMARILSESPTASDALGRLTAVSRSLSNSLSSSESLARFVGISRSIGESAAVSVSVNRFTCLPRTISESFSAQGLTSRTIVVGRTIAETVKAVGTAVRAYVMWLGGPGPGPSALGIITFTVVPDTFKVTVGEPVRIPIQLSWSGVIAIQVTQLEFSGDLAKYFVVKTKLPHETTAGMALLPTTQVDVEALLPSDVRSGSYSLPVKAYAETMDGTRLTAEGPVYLDVASPVEPAATSTWILLGLLAAFGAAMVMTPSRRRF